MTSSWVASEDQSAEFVELFFDLVFVFAITRITYLLAHDLSWQGAYHAALILWMVWWAWTQFTWSLNPADTGHGPVRAVILLATAVAFFMAEAVPHAFDSTGVPFAVAYVIVRALGMSVFFQITSGEANRRAVTMFTLWSLGGMVAVIAGAFVASPLREAFWLVAIVLDLVTVWRAGEGDWTVHPRHFTERHGLIVIIALGETLIATGVSLEGLDRGLTFYSVGGAAVALICALWWTYFGRTRGSMEEWLAENEGVRRGKLARDHYSIAHVFLIGGVIAIAVALEEAVGHADRSLGAAGLLALGAGVGLYLGTLAFAVIRSGGRSVHWILGIASIPLVLFGIRSALPLAVLGSMAALLILLSWADHVLN